MSFKGKSNFQNTLDEVSKFLTDNGYIVDNEAKMLLVELRLKLDITDENELLRILLKAKKKHITLTEDNVNAEIELHISTRNKQSQRFKFYILFDFQGPLNFSIGDVTISSVNKDDYSSLISTIQNLQATNYSKIDLDFQLKQLNYHFIEFQLYDSSATNAYTRFYSAFSLFKGVLEFSYQAGTLSYSLTQNARRYISKFNHPGFYLLKTDSTSELRLYDEVFIGRVKHSTKHEHKDEKFNELIAKFSSAPSSKSIWYLLSNCFRLYDLAIGHPYKEQSFLFFWNVLEELTCSNDFNGKNDEVLRRAKSFMKEGFSLKYSALLKDLIRVRNNYVHRGIEEVDDIHVNLLKLLVEAGILSYLESTNKIDTVEKLRLYYEIKFRMDSEQVILSEMLDLLLTKKGLKGN